MIKFLIKKISWFLNFCLGTHAPDESLDFCKKDIHQLQLENTLEWR